MQQLIPSLEQKIVPIDGKCLRGSDDRENGIKALHLVTAWVPQQNLTLGQIKVEDHSNEITAIPALLELIDTFNEDQSRIPSGNAPRNFALLRRMALNALNLEKTLLRSLRQKSKRTSMNNDYMVTVLRCFCQ